MLFFLLYKIGIILALIFPVRIGYKVAGFISDIKYLFSPLERREIVENLKLVLPDTDVKTLRRYSKEIFRNFSKYLVDFFRFEKVDLDYVKGHVEIVHKDYIDEALKKGKGVMILSAHLGNWELGGITMGLLGYPMNAIVLEQKNKLVNRFFVNQREMKNEKVIPMSFAARKCLNVLMNNELLAIMGDKDYTNNGVIVKFFGRDTLFPKGPAAFSLKTGAVIVPGATIRTDKDYFKLIFDKPVEYSPGADFDKDLTALAQRCADALEDFIRKYPDQWYCFRRFWQ